MKPTDEKTSPKNWTLRVNGSCPEVIPNNDIKGHNLYPMPCDCKPEFVKGVWVHGAFDNREAVERAEDILMENRIEKGGE